MTRIRNTAAPRSTLIQHTFGAAMCACAWLFGASAANAAAPFAVGGDPSVDPQDFRVTTFATGLVYPYAMAPLADGSIVVGTGSAPNFFGSSGKVIRLSDATDSGTATSSQVLYSGLPGPVTQVSHYGNLYAVTTNNSQTEAPQITFLAAGATPSSPLTNVGSMNLSFPTDSTGYGWDHTSYGSAVAPVPGDPSSFRLFFNVGSEYNFAGDALTPTVSGLLSGPVQGSSIYMVTVHDTGGPPTISGLTQIASGLRNAEAIGIQPGTGDLWFVDNGIDGTSGNPYAAISADALHTIPAAQIGHSVPNFGFPTSYTAYYTGNYVGGTGIPPVVAFQPIPDTSSGSKSQGATQLVFTPNAFPGALQNGVFVGFHGRFLDAGIANDENPLIFSSLSTGHYFDFLSNDLPLGHPDGLMSTNGSLFVADMSSNGSLLDAGAGQGVIYQIKAITPGDTNGDGIVNGLDISAVASHWLQTGEAALGDANNDGIVNALDIALIASHWLQTGPPGGGVSVPEPSMLVLAVLGALALLAWRCRIA